MEIFLFYETRKKQVRKSKERGFNLIRSHVPMEIFLFYETRKKQARKSKERPFMQGEVPILVCSPEVWEHPQVPTL
jgi:hypothetical protein